MDSRPRKVAILLFDDVELLDFAGPFEVFSSVRASDNKRMPLMDVFAVAEKRGAIRCRNGLIVQPAYTLEDCPPADILLVPGGFGTDAAAKSQPIIRWLQERSTSADLVTSVCTGSFVLAQDGLLDGQGATTYWSSVSRLQEQFPGLKAQPGARWVDNGKTITAAGVSAGIDMALHIVQRLYGAEIAQATARGIEYEHWGQE
jgi:transcriptional regulator GlxA family with amidase domain